MGLFSTDFSKPGRGVDKNAAKKRRFFQYWEIVMRKWSKMLLVSLLFSLIAVPSFILTSFIFLQNALLWRMGGIMLCFALIGPAFAALVKITWYFTEEKPVFLWSDFWHAWAQNFKQSFLMGLFDGAIVYAVFEAYNFYLFRIATESGIYWIPLIFIMLLALLAIMMNFYSFLLIVTVNLKFIAVLKNAMSLVFLGGKTNFFTLLFACLIVIPSALLWPVLFAFIFFGVAMLALLFAFNSFPAIYKYCIRPYYVANNLPNPYEADLEELESVFEDQG